MLAGDRVLEWPLVREEEDPLLVTPANAPVEHGDGRIIFYSVTRGDKDISVNEIRQLLNDYPLVPLRAN